MRSIPVIKRVAAWLLLLAPAAALADGMVFHPTAIGSEVRIPDQRALICFSNGLERLVIETRFVGSGSNFAWVVPLPAKPVIEPATTGLFPTLQYLFRPRLHHDVPRYYLALMAVMGGVYLLFFIQPGSRLNESVAGAGSMIIACCMVAGATAVAAHTAEMFPVLLALAFLLVLVARFLVGEGFVAVLVGILALVVISLMLMPSLGRSRQAAASSTSQAVSILDRQVAGVFETTTIASREPKALRDWLEANGFALPKRYDAVIADYVNSNWVFVAAKVRRAQTNEAAATPHPLSFTFPTSRAVYPMRLTGIENRSLQVELYVFGAGQSAARHFQAERCAQANYPPLSRDWASWDGTFFPRDETLNVVHPLLRQWAAGAPVATKLAATLTPQDMRQDVWLDWKPFAEKRSEVFSQSGALTKALNWAFSLMPAALLVWLITFRQPRPRRLAWSALAVLAAWWPPDGFISPSPKPKSVWCEAPSEQWIGGFATFPIFWLTPTA